MENNSIPTALTPTTILDTTLYQTCTKSLIDSVNKLDEAGQGDTRHHHITISPEVALKHLTILFQFWAIAVNVFGFANYIPKAFDIIMTPGIKPEEVEAKLADMMTEVMEGQTLLDFDPQPVLPVKYGSEEEEIVERDPSTPF